MLSRFAANALNCRNRQVWFKHRVQDSVRGCVFFALQPVKYASVCHLMRLDMYQIRRIILLNIYNVFQVIASGLILTLLFVPPAHAQSNACRQLAARLSAVSVGNNADTSPQYREYDDAIRQQKIQLNKTMKIAKRSGCLRRTLFGFGKKSGRCGRILDGIERMEENLQYLQNTRNQYSSSGGNAAQQRNQILKEMQQRRCNVSGVVDTREASTKPRRRSLVEQIFGVRTYGDDGRRGVDEYGVDLGIANKYNTFRTLCVRTCDGYYFPISFSTVPERFNYDESVCSAMCPGTEVELFHHRMPLEDSEEMISYRTSLPYAEQPFAFSYRKEINKECGCRFATSNLTEIAGAEQSADPTPNKPVVRIGVPVSRPLIALDPDSRENKAGNLSLAQIALMIERSITVAESGNSNQTDLAENRKVRIVGPAFYPVQ